MGLMEDSKRFDQIFAPVKKAGFEAGYERIGTLWQMWVYGPAGTYGGARENGESLARELADKALGKVAAYTPAPKPVPDELAKLRARIAELEAERLKPADNITVPDFLKPEPDMNFHDDFIAREALDGEERADTVARLQLLFEVLTNRSYGGPLSDTDQARLSELTTNLRLGG